MLKRLKLVHVKTTKKALETFEKQIGLENTNTSHNKPSQPSSRIFPPHLMITNQQDGSKIS
jgi:hypothetical protein